MLRGQLAAHSRDIWCRVFKDKIVYEIPTHFGCEATLGRMVTVEVALQHPEQRYSHDLLKKELFFKSDTKKIDYKTDIKVEEIPRLV